MSTGLEGEREGEGAVAKNLEVGATKRVDEMKLAQVEARLRTENDLTRNFTPDGRQGATPLFSPL